MFGFLQTDCAFDLHVSGLFVEGQHFPAALLGSRRDNPNHGGRLQIPISEKLQLHFGGRGDRFRAQLRIAAVVIESTYQGFGLLDLPCADKFAALRISAAGD